VDLPIENGGSFHSYVTVYQRVFVQKDGIKNQLVPSGKLFITMERNHHRNSEFFHETWWIFPYKSPFSHGFPTVFLLNMVIFHRFLLTFTRPGKWAMVDVRSTAEVITCASGVSNRFATMVQLWPEIPVITTKKTPFIECFSSQL